MSARLAMAALAGWAVPLMAQPVDYRLDPTHSLVHFELAHFGASTIRGRTAPLDGQVTLDRQARSGRVQVVVDMAAVNTGIAALDARLRGAELFDVAAHPQAYFVAERFDVDADGALRSLRGEFTLRGQSQGLTLQAERWRCYTSPLLRREVCGGDFSAMLSRSAYGLTLGLPFVGDEVRLRIAVEAVRQSP